VLDELQVAARVASLTADERLALVTSAAAGILRDPDAGRLERGLSADLIVIPSHAGPAGDALTACRRAQVQLVVTEGRPRLGAPERTAMFAARGVTTARLRVDGYTRVADAQVVRALVRYGIGEPGVDVCQ
jgi:cytosine/adenosine deaminase-related metal-dependent hydrolase